MCRGIPPCASRCPGRALLVSREPESLMETASAWLREPNGYPARQSIALSSAGDISHGSIPLACSPAAMHVSTVGGDDFRILHGGCECGGPPDRLCCGSEDSLAKSCRAILAKPTGGQDLHQRIHLPKNTHTRQIESSRRNVQPRVLPDPSSALIPKPGLCRTGPIQLFTVCIIPYRQLNATGIL